MKDKDYYLNLNYNYEIKPIVDGSGSYYWGRGIELEGCFSYGNTLEELYNNLTEALKLYIDTKISGGFSIPEPIGNKNHTTLSERIKMCSDEYVSEEWNTGVVGIETL